jgi:hypothetical protein
MPVKPGIRVSVKKLIRGDPEPVLDSQNIVRREDQLECGAAVSKTLDAFMAGENEGVSF